MNVHCVSDLMSKKGWSLNALQKPNSVHLCCTVKHINNESLFIDDLQSCVNVIRKQMLDSNGNAQLQGIN